MSRTMLSTIIDEVRLVVHGDQQPDDAEWDEHIAGTRAAMGTFRVSVVVSDGAAPDARQRAKMAEDSAFMALPLAVVTSSAAVRGAVTALSWVDNSRISAFAPTEYDEVFGFLQVPRETQDKVLREIGMLKTRLAMSTPVTGPRPVVSAAAAEGEVGNMAENLEQVVQDRVATIRKRLAGRR